MTSEAKSLTVDEIAAICDGRVRGDGTIRISGLCSLDEPSESGIAFLREPSRKALREIFTEEKLGALLIMDALESSVEGCPFPLILVPDPLKALVKILPHLHRFPDRPSGISEKAEINPSAIIAKDVSIGAFCVIGKDVRLDECVVIHPHVVIYEGAHIGARTIIHSGAAIREFVSIGPDNIIQNGAVIGADGFGYIPDPKQGLVAVPQIGTVRTNDFVDIGANSCVDRATLGTTRIGSRTKLDNQVQVGHNVTIGSNSILCGQVGIAGSCKIGNRVVLGGNAGVADHITIVDGARFGAKAGVHGDVKKPGDYVGYPLIPAKGWKRWYRHLLEVTRTTMNGREES